jgi:hypothetical protein
LLKNRKLAEDYGNDVGGQVGSLRWVANTLHDNDDYKLQDLSLGDDEKQHNGYYQNSLETKGMYKKKQTQRKNINRSIVKKGKEKKTYVIDDRKKFHSKSYINNTKKPYLSASKKEKKFYHNHQYKYGKKKKNKQYGMMIMQHP